MVSARPIEANDEPLLALSLAKDEYHQGTMPEFFYAPKTMCNVHEDERGPIMFMRGTKALRIDIEFVDNNDHERNAAALLAVHDSFVEQARANGFTELVFCSNSRGLRALCKRRFGFRELDGELRKLL